MNYKTLGKTGEKLSAIGLGCMGMSFAYGQADEQESIRTLYKALDSGINFWDTADMYANGKNEELISKVLVPNRDKIFIATKFGFRFKNNEAGPSNSANTYFDGSPEWIRQAVDNSLQRLRIDTIDLYYAHRIDPNVPVEETVGAMAELVKAGKVRYLGLSEASAESIRKANAIHPIAALQSEYSLLTRDVEESILPVVRELGISLVPYSPLARGLFNNINEVQQLEDSDFRKSLPRYQEAYLENNKSLAKELNELAASKGITGSQLALAWVLAQGDDIIPIPGTKRVKYLEQNIEAASVTFTETEKSQIEEIVKKYPNTGPRYSEGSMKLVNN
ncbi:aldo/keto reductase [Elizabethkingia anophelis]|uniref:aldo/keto reductase n=1 Tax=Elizabethkingia anophelis TaxID=1117645 RepID=UPI000994AD23|nr:aldo/keto reductase [Elizabethkingia anophelis]AQW95395.1 aldo/keto reductase [Elizabethkingia anophelis]MCT3959091.1 aldo/keto reductase [Elizabethkingia anophelis]MCW2463038.1 aryl-alcohol dehydrogenase-like predicted oxidoreductase [Elizabethkingia anophelis]MCW2466723.1 aryl-alcohol dehydrogenase-like predicted oxidoreductase [Elizabethkingia anophelis]MCW2471129.1 aryl-alcohol dehydrogenase-like predicted oxidoreductase [Elizabethkingia anophelis]